MIARQPGKIGDIADIDGPTPRRHRVAEFKILEEFLLRVNEVACRH
jgi:hypothetical protein